MNIPYAFSTSFVSSIFKSRTKELPQHAASDKINLEHLQTWNVLDE